MVSVPHQNHINTTPSLWRGLARGSLMTWVMLGSVLTHVLFVGWLHLLPDTQAVFL